FTGSAPVTNCIFWRNIAFFVTGNTIFTELGEPKVTYSDISDAFAGVGAVNVDPLFLRNPSPGPDAVWGTVDDDYGDLHLQPDSPLVDAGSNSALPVDVMTDLAGNNRFQDVPTTPDSGEGTAPIVDIGAYETAATLAVNAGGPYAVLSGQSI